MSAKAKKLANPQTALVLRVCNADMSSQHGFVWPAAGETATAPDWRKDNECGHGLHGWLHGAGDYTSATIQTDSRWLVVEVELKSIVALGGKVKFPSGKVLFVGERKDAADFLIAHDPLAAGLAVIGACLTVGDKQSVMVGALGTATAGDSGTATAGYRGTATAGDSGTATAGYRGTATAGYSGTATAGYSGTATAGDSGTATAGYSGTATAGDRGEIRVRYWDSKNQRYRTVIGYVGEDGIKANTPYRLDDSNKLVPA